MNGVMAEFLFRGEDALERFRSFRQRTSLGEFKPRFHFFFRPLGEVVDHPGGGAAA